MSGAPGTNGRRHPFEPIAIIGRGCVLPDAHGVDQFWENLRAGHSSIREVPSDRWDPAVYYSPDRHQADKTYSKIGSFVEGFHFDWRRFRIPPKVLEQIDPSQQWALEASAQALADAGYDRRGFDRTRCGVVLGNSGGGEIRVRNSLRIYFARSEAMLRESKSFQALAPEVQAGVMAEFREAYLRGIPLPTEDTLAGELSNVIAGRVANLFGLSGPNSTSDAACASSMSAIESACHALQSHVCDLVLSGGSDHFQEPSLYVKFCRLGALSATGSRPFDAQADGFVMGEGCVVFLLKRLADAQRDGDRVHAVIRGIGSSSDGSGKGITAPRADGQVAAITRALEAAGLAPSDIDAIEAHGTGTVVGDATEITALAQVFRDAQGPKVALGSVKSNIGHLKSAAGAAAMLKAVLALGHATLPPTIGVRRPNPMFEEEGVRVEPVLVARAWPARATSAPRRIGVSGFGFGGTNFHVVLEEAAPLVVTPAPIAGNPRP
jgi:acyl transferase domain-containing protein